MPNWFKPKLLEGTKTYSEDQFCTIASQQIALREMCNRDEYYVDRFNVMTESKRQQMLKTKTVTSKSRKSYKKTGEKSRI